jgi:hypothetical protein
VAVSGDIAHAPRHRVRMTHGQMIAGKAEPCLLFADLRSRRPDIEEPAVRWPRQGP